MGAGGKVNEFFTFLKGRKGKVNVCFFSPFLNTFLTLPVSIGKTVMLLQ